MLFRSDGLGYDGADDTVWASADASNTLVHYSTAGAVLGTFTVNLGGYGNSGIAVGGPELFLANNGGSQIYRSNKTLTSTTLFATFPVRLEDLECDDRTFSGQGVGAIWSIDAYDRDLRAWEVQAGVCGFGGVAVPVMPWPAMLGLAVVLAWFTRRTLQRRQPSALA